MRLAYILDDQTLIAKARSRLDPVVDGVLNGGESFFYWLGKDQLDDNFNNWAHSHMGRALVAYYQATRDPRILEALVKVYRDYPLPDMVSKYYPVSGAVNLDPMLETCALSGDEQVLRNAMEYAGRAGFQELVDRWIKGDCIEGHTVIAYENMRVPALLFPWTGNRRHLKATEAALDWGHRTHGLPLGLMSGEEFAAGIGSTRNLETCDVAAGPWTYTWMLRITGEAGYGDRLERVFFNAGPAPVARDFGTMAYYQSPNRFSTTMPKDRPMHPGGKHDSYSFTEIGHEVLCYAGHLNRVIPNYIMHMWMATPDEGLAATLYGPARVRAVVADGAPVEISADTEYPFEDTIRLKLTTEAEVDFPLYVRLPEWANGPVAEINGEVVSLTKAANGFARIARRWSDGDSVTLRFPMSVTIEHGRETDYPDLEYYEREGSRRLARERGIANPFASVFHGPLLFALPIRDDGPNQASGSVRFNYALDMQPDADGEGAKLERQPMPSRWRWNLEETPLRLRVPARAFAWTPSDAAAAAGAGVRRGGTGSRTGPLRSCQIPLLHVPGDGFDVAGPGAVEAGRGASRGPGGPPYNGKIWCMIVWSWIADREGYMSNLTTMVPALLQQEEAAGALMALFGGVAMLVWVALMLVFIIGGWKVFVKAGQPGWAVLVPFYNFYIMVKIAGKPGWWFLLLMVPIANIVVAAIVCIGFAKAFGQSALFGIVFLFLLGVIGVLILGFGSSRYMGPAIDAPV